ncbi:hypothetical protein [Salimicrobium flavidum]|uniref:hypothetical protein n=1 Tax=Salimicrobium flavidum TaxID=570947 RepID=UPI00117AF992|nr:hypothetical protein [Salimicrobium flavidum]
MLNIKDPSQKEQMADLWKDGLEESRSFEDFRFAAFIQNQEGTLTDVLPDQPASSISEYMSYTWENWNLPENEERLKQSYDILQKTFSEY